MNKNVRTYETDSLKIIWKPDVCAHAGECVKGLPDVFNVKNKPWISPENAASKEIMDVIDRCPSKALSYKNKTNETI